MATIPYADKTEEQKKKLLPKDQQNLANAAKAASAKDYGGSDNPTLEGVKNFAGDAVSGTVDAVKDIGTELLALGATSGVGQVATSPLSKLPYVGGYLGKISPFMRSLRSPQALAGTVALTGGYKLGEEFEKQYRDTPVLDNPLVRGMQNVAGAIASSPLVPFNGVPFDPKEKTQAEMQAQMDFNDARDAARLKAGQDVGSSQLPAPAPTEAPVAPVATEATESPASAPAPERTYEEMVKEIDSYYKEQFPEKNGTPSQFEGSSLRADGTTRGNLTDGTSRTMTPEEVDAFEKSRVAGTANEYSKPMGEYQAVEGTQGSVQLPLSSTLEPKISKEQLIGQFDEMRKSGLSSEEKEQKSKELMANYFASQNEGNQASGSNNSQGSGMTELEAKMLSDFENFKKSGKEMTPEMENKAKLLAASTGRTFDSETGYNKEFSPEIMRIYNEAVDSGEVKPVRYRERDTLKAAGREIDAREAKSNAEYEANKIEMDKESQLQKESGGVSIRVGGEMVPATKENRARQQQEKALGAEADRNGLRGAEKKQFIADGMQTRSDDDYNRDRDRIKDQLEISTAEADLELRRRKLLPEAPERPDPSKVSKFIDTAKDLGLTYDTETGLFKVDKDWAKDPVLDPSDPQYAKLQEMEGSEFFLQPPSDVMENYEELTTIAKTDTNGYARVKADDGRIFKIYPDGNYEHTGYEKP
jgi:hypothetical protein